MQIETFAALVIGFWTVAGFCLFLYGWVNPVVLIAYAVSRILSVGDLRFDERVNTPTHAALQCFCTAVNGLLLPTFYFLSIRTRSEIGFWGMGRGTNTWWTMTLGVACMIWLCSHLLAGALRLDRPRFGPSWTNRAIAAAGVALCLWFHARSYLARHVDPAGEFGDAPQFLWILLKIVYPQLMFLGTTLVFASALRESLGQAGAAVPSRRWMLPIALSAATAATLFAPFWLSIPRVSHRSAIALLEENQEAITEISREADLDPRLLAGIIYVAHTRDHPRWTGDAIERVGFAVVDKEVQRYGPTMQFKSPIINASAGLCQIRPTTAMQTAIFALDGRGMSSSGGNVTVTGQYLTQNAYPWRNAVNRGFPAELGDFGLDPLRELPSSLPARLVRRTEALDLESLLFEEKDNLSTAAAMLWILRSHWRYAGHPIDDRPEILATLYNLGYERSEPKPDPRPNDFGRRVAAFMETDECRRLFPEQPDAGDSSIPQWSSWTTQETAP